MSHGRLVHRPRCMRAAIAGGTGTLGRPLTDLLRAQGHDARPLSRSAPQFPVDLRSGDGLAAALDGVDVVFHAHNGGKAVLLDGSRRLLWAADAHHVLVSIVGIEDVPVPYYRWKLAQEELVRGSGRPWSIVRATQFHELVAKLERFRSRAQFQPVDPRDVAEVCAQVGAGHPLGRAVQVAGPERVTLTGPIPLPLPPRLGRALRAGKLTAAHPDHVGSTTRAQWAR